MTTADRPTPVLPAKVNVLYVGGMARSGSTLTDLMLATLPGHVAVGELRYMWRNGLLHDGVCSCGATFSRCPFWVEVGTRAYGGWHNIDGQRVVELQYEVLRTQRIPLVLARRPPAFVQALDEYTTILQALYAAIAAVAGAEVVVDSSKRGALAYVVRSMPGIRLTVAHVLRDPRGVAYSFSKTVDLPAGTDFHQEMPRVTPRRIARRPGRSR